MQKGRMEEVEERDDGEEREDRPEEERIELWEEVEEEWEEVTGTHSQHWPEQEPPPHVPVQRRTENSGQSTETALHEFWTGSKRTVQMEFRGQTWMWKEEWEEEEG